MRLRYKVGLVFGILAAVFLWGRCSRSGPKAPTVLPANDKEQIIVDPVKHQLIVLTPGHETVTTLPDHKTTIDLHNDGSVKVTSPQMDAEAKPFLGVGYGQGVRAYLGLDVWYFKKLDFGIGLATPSMTNHSGMNYNDVRAFVALSYNVWDNSRVSMGIDNQKAIHVLFSVRI